MEKNNTIGIIGLGAMGRVIAEDLSRTYRGKVVYLVRDVKSVKDIAAKNNAEARYADVAKKETLVKALDGINVVIHAVHHEYNLTVMEACLKTSTNYIDLGGLYHYTKKQLKLNSKFKKQKLIAVIGMGACPGTTNVLAKYASEFFDKIKNIEIKVAYCDYSSYSQKPPFFPPYSVQTLFEELSWKPAVFRNKKTVFVDPVSGIEEYKFPEPVGKKKILYSIHSEIATLPYTLKADNVSFKVSFDDELLDQIMSLKKLGFLSEKKINVKGISIVPSVALVEVLKKLSKPVLEKREEYEVMRVVVTGIKNKKHREIVIDSRMGGKNIGADLDTGVPPSIVSQMIAKNKINKFGVFSPESVIPEAEFFKELAKRSIFVYLNNKRIKK